ncbi:response regulator, partial [Pseudodesulfovibrio sp.]|nr:response regulator [Pseudodesulfovibrio sp.]
SFPYQVHDTSEKSHSVLVGKSLLLIDDRDYAQAALASRLERSGARVDILRHGSPPSAIQASYDAAIIHGTDRKNMRATYSTWLDQCGIPSERIIMLVSDMDHEFILDSPAAILTKPAYIPEIERALANILHPTRSKSIQTKDAGSSLTNKELSLILIEDSLANSMLIELYLKDSKHQLLVAEDGMQGLELYKREGADIVFMDVEMPIMDGIECTERLRTWEKENDIPPVQIVALTAHALSEVKEKTLAAGCNAFLTKPISRKDFLGKIDHFLANEVQ